MSSTIDPFATETGGGFTTEYEGVIEDAYFGTDPRYNEGKTTLLFWKMRTGEPVPDGVDPSKQPGPTLVVEERFSVGDGWQSFDGGATVEHPVPDKRFHASSLYGTIIDRCVQDLGIRDVLASRGEPKSAAMWKGLTFRMSQEDIDYGSQIGVKQRTLPQAFLGEGIEPRKVLEEGTGGEGTPSVSPAQASPAPGEQIGAQSPSQPSSPNGPVSGGWAGLSEATQAALRQAAATSNSHSDFIDKAMEVEGVITNKELVQSLASESGLYSELKNA